MSNTSMSDWEQDLLNRAIYNRTAFKKSKIKVLNALRGLLKTYSDVQSYSGLLERHGILITEEDNRLADKLSGDRKLRAFNNIIDDLTAFIIQHRQYFRRELSQ